MLALSRMIFFMTSLLIRRGNIAIFMSISFADRTFFSSKDGFVITTSRAVIPKNGNIERRVFPVIFTSRPVFSYITWLISGIGMIFSTGRNREMRNDSVVITTSDHITVLNIIFENNDMDDVWTVPILFFEELSSGIVSELHFNVVRFYAKTI